MGLCPLGDPPAHRSGRHRHRSEIHHLIYPRVRCQRLFEESVRGNQLIQRYRTFVITRDQIVFDSDDMRANPMGLRSRSITRHTLIVSGFSAS